jgi:hypothetical protein
MGSPTRYAYYEKKMLGWILEKIITQKSTPGGGKFFASGSNYPTVVRNSSWDNAHTSNPSNRGERPSRKPNALVQRTRCTGGSSDG